MSNDEFMERLQRISDQSVQQAPVVQDAPKPGRVGQKRSRSGAVGIGGAVIGLGLVMLKYVNANYDVLKQSDAPGIIAIVGIGGAALFLCGFIVIIRATFRMNAGPEDVSDRHFRTPSRKARIIFSLLGFAFGAIACFEMFVAGAARYVESETAQAVAIGGTLVAALLAILSLLFGMVGLFLRGRGLGRVPAYFALGGVLTYATVQVLQINLLEWQDFMVALQ